MSIWKGFGPSIARSGRLHRVLGLVLLMSFVSGCEHRQVARVEIDAPIEVVWAYISDSSKAAEWSIFFDHIAPLPGVPDGQVGALRRCYRCADRSGLTWDEQVMQIQAPYFREIRTYALRGFNIFGAGTAAFRVHQSLRRLGPHRTELIFSSSVEEPRPSVWNLYFMGYATAEAGLIVQKNVENIKYFIENPRGVSPPHAFLAQHAFDRQLCADARD
jgi:hypothetical protein